MYQARNQVFSEQGSLRLCAQYSALATAFAEHFNSMHVKEYWMRNFFNFLGVDGATHIAGFPSEVNDAVEVIKSKAMKAAFSKHWRATQCADSISFVISISLWRQLMK